MRKAYYDDPYKHVIAADERWVELELHQVGGKTSANKRLNLKGAAAARRLRVFVSIRSGYGEIRLVRPISRVDRIVRKRESPRTQVDAEGRCPATRLSAMSLLLLGLVKQNDNSLSPDLLARDADCSVDLARKHLRRLERQGLIGVQEFYFAK